MIRGPSKIRTKFKLEQVTLMKKGQIPEYPFGCCRQRDNRWGLNSIGIGLALLVLYSTGAAVARAAVGDVLATFPFQAGTFIADPNQHLMYATNPSAHAIEVINTQTLTVTSTIVLPGTPTGMAMAPSGTLYVSDSTNSSVDVINTQSLSLLKSISIARTPYDVAVGLNNRLYVLDDTPNYPVGSPPDTIKQIDAVSGSQAGPDFPYPDATYYGHLQMSPDQKTLYYAEAGLSPSTLKAFGVSTTTPTVLREVETGTNGEALALSHSGNLIAQADGGGGLVGPPYSITLFRSSDFSAVGSFNAGAYPNAITFSPDDKFVYASIAPGPSQVEIFSTTTFARLGQFSVPDDSSTMLTDSTGRQLFVSFLGLYNGFHETVVYDTGYQVPEPATFWLLAIGVFALWCHRRRLKPGTAT